MGVAAAAFVRRFLGAGTSSTALGMLVRIGGMRVNQDDVHSSTTTSARAAPFVTFRFTIFASKPLAVAFLADVLRLFTGISEMSDKGLLSRDGKDPAATMAAQAGRVGITFVMGLVLVTATSIPMVVWTTLWVAFLVVVFRRVLRRVELVVCILRGFKFSAKTSVTRGTRCIGE
jgi:hypothetical protein